MWKVLTKEAQYGMNEKYMTKVYNAPSKSSNSSVSLDSYVFLVDIVRDSRRTAHEAQKRALCVPHTLQIPSHTTGVDRFLVP